MFEVGRLCVKIAGRDAGHYCIIVDVVNDKMVLVDGNVRRKKCNIKHLEPIDMVTKIKKGASTSEVKKALTEIGIPIKEREVKRKTKKNTSKPLKQRKTSVKKPKAAKK